MNDTKQVENVMSGVRMIWIKSLILGLLGSVILSGPTALAEDMRPEVTERVKKATLMVFNKASKTEKGDTPLGSGSGYFINSTGLLITNNHVVDPGHGKDPATKWKLTNQYNLLVQTVITDSGTDDEKGWECDLLYTNEFADQALLQALDEDGEKLETPNFLRFMPESRLKEGMEIVAMGFPGGDSRRTSGGQHPEANVVKGNVLEIPRTSSGRARMITTDAELRAGNSGGPVVNRDGLLVGTLTIGMANEERRNYNGLVPAALTRGFVTGAFTLNKVPGGTDYAPLMDMLTSSQSRLEIPEYSRMKDQDVLYFEDGDRIYGRMEGATLTWDSALGAITVPSSTVAYVLNNDEGSHLFLKGGNRIASEEADATFEFTPVDGEKISRDFSDVKAIAFRMGDEESPAEVDRLIVLDSDLTNLRLSKVEGTVGFTGKAGTIQLKLEDIERIESTEDDEHRVILADGRKMTGEFSEEKFKGTIAATNTPIEFGLGGVTTAMVEFVTHDPNATEGLDLSDLLTSAGREERALLKLLRTGDAASVRAKINEITADKKGFRERSEKQRERFQLLYAVATMRDGDGTASQKLFRRVRKSENENIAAYAQAYIDILKEYDDFKFRDRPLSDKTAFVAAGEALSGDYIRTARNAIEDGNSREGKNKGEYFSVISAAKKNEPKMRVAAIFRGSLAEHELVRLWRMAVSGSQRELRRIQDEQRQIQEDAQQRGGGRGAMRRKLDELAEHRDRVAETMHEYERKLDEFGFRIEDPDLQKIREREEERRAAARDRDD